MAGQIWITFGVLISVMLSLAASRVAPDMILLGGLVILVVTGVLSPEDAFSGFSNEGVATIGALFVVAEGLRRTGSLNVLGMRMLGAPRNVGQAQLRMMVPVAALSAFMNNTPVVATMMPIVSDWARRNRISVSSLLLPLSYASILGGMLTLVGTSTTLVVNGLMLAEPGIRGLRMFELTWVGLPVLLAALAYVPLASRYLLTERRPAIDQMDDPREYTVELVVSNSSPVAGQSIEDAGLRRLPGMFLMEIQRESHVIAAPGPDTQIIADDRLVFCGVVESVVDLQKIPGLTPAADQLFKIDEPRSHRVLVEAVVSSSCRFLGMTIREAKFRTQYNAVVIAVARHGERISKKIGDITLQAGDTLLLETVPSFVEVQRNSRDFFLVSSIEDSTPVQHERAWIARGILAAMVLVVALELTSMLNAACVAGGLMIVTRCLRVSQAKRSIDWGVLLGIGAGLGIGAAMSTSGAADVLAEAVVTGVSNSPLVALIAIYLVTTLLAHVITTQAAAVLIFPVAVAVTRDLDVDFMPFGIALVVAAASAYATPVGYQTNLMVYGPGGYRGIDFLKVGGPLALIAFVATILIAPMVWPF
jgi:di/tricarboxylate transporter